MSSCAKYFFVTVDAINPMKQYLHKINIAYTVKTRCFETAYSLNFTAHILLMTLKVLSQDWSDYERRKEGELMIFNCEDSWEVDFLVQTILKVYPNNTEASVRIAIAACCLSMPRPRARNKVVTCVMSRL